MLQLLLDGKKRAVIISPLRVLQEDQAERFKNVNLSGAPVNGIKYMESSSSEGSNRDLKDGHYRAILTSPETVSSTSPSATYSQARAFEISVRSSLKKPIAFGDSGFRPLPAKSENCALSSLPTFPFSRRRNPHPSDVQEVHLQLSINAGNCFFLNLGSDRSNMAYSIKLTIEYFHTFTR
ncbi:hypothetical protein M413DRAFT_132087 [Hebeloma cylindrosporum]|uniref:Uncharacterized protein n=1 Tax=Hebeloma cylindrosporum TaxID=76867 RepID=A0A0C3CFF1_HEBCY|nr:hypothetical protein M413DRAFT_132087 [Hebeloma cylindrosporum h7]